MTGSDLSRTVTLRGMPPGGGCLSISFDPLMPNGPVVAALEGAGWGVSHQAFEVTVADVGVQGLGVLWFEELAGRCDEINANRELMAGSDSFRLAFEMEWLCISLGVQPPTKRQREGYVLVECFLAHPDTRIEPSMSFRNYRGEVLFVRKTFACTFDAVAAFAADIRAVLVGVSRPEDSL